MVTTSKAITPSGNKKTNSMKIELDLTDDQVELLLDTLSRRMHDYIQFLNAGEEALESQAGETRFKTLQRIEKLMAKKSSLKGIFDSINLQACDSSLS
jgi:hypothetical protein